MNFSTFVQDLCSAPTTLAEHHQAKSKQGTSVVQQRINISKETERFLMATVDHKLSFKTGMRTLAHTVTSQALHPLSVPTAFASSSSPVHYFEVRVIKIQDKEVNRFGIGLAKANYPYLRLVGTKDSVGLRGDGKVFVNETEEKLNSSIFVGANGATTGEKSIVNSVVGVGFESRQGKVFFTLNGKEILSVAESSKIFEGFGADQIYPTFSMGSLDDKIQVNFGQTQFMFNIKAKVNVSTFFHLMGILLFRNTTKTYSVRYARSLS